MPKRIGVLAVKVQLFFRPNGAIVKTMQGAASIPNKPIKDAILHAALPVVAFDGWTRKTLEQAALEAGYQKSMVVSVFPAGVKDALWHFSRMADEGMLETLQGLEVDTLKIRERIEEGVWARLMWLEPHREAERLAIAYWMRPLRKWEGAKLVWKSADALWDWAGDTASDYNRYTKRMILSAVLSATTLCWLNDESAGREDTRAFLRRRIDNALALGKITARFKKTG